MAKKERNGKKKKAKCAGALLFVRLPGVLTLYMCVVFVCPKSGAIEQRRLVLLAIFSRFTACCCYYYFSLFFLLLFLSGFKIVISNDT